MQCTKISLFRSHSIASRGRHRAEWIVCGACGATAKISAQNGYGELSLHGMSVSLVRKLDKRYTWRSVHTWLCAIPTNYKVQLTHNVLVKCVVNSNFLRRFINIFIVSKTRSSVRRQDKRHTENKAIELSFKPQATGDASDLSVFVSRLSDKMYLRQLRQR